MRPVHYLDYNNTDRGVGSQRIPRNSTPSIIREMSLLNNRATSSYTDNPYIRSFQMNEKPENFHSPAVVRRHQASSVSSEISHDKEGVRFAASSAERGREKLFDEATRRVEDTQYEVYHTLFHERAMRHAAERRTVEESEKGARASIVIEAIYGARLLYSVFIETLAGLPPAENPWLSPRRIFRKTPLKSPACDDDVKHSRPVETTPDRQLSNNIKLKESTTDNGRLLEENTRLREEVERYRNIDLEDRRDINELHRNMQLALEQCERERDELYYELRGHWPAFNREKVYGSSGLCSHIAKEEEAKEHVHPQKKAKDYNPLWHYTHIVDPSATNMEESPELLYRRCVFPRSL